MLSVSKTPEWENAAGNFWQVASLCLVPWQNTAIVATCDNVYTRSNQKYEEKQQEECAAKLPSISQTVTDSRFEAALNHKKQVRGLQPGMICTHVRDGPNALCWRNGECNMPVTFIKRWNVCCCSCHTWRIWNSSAVSKCSQKIKNLGANL